MCWDCNLDCIIHQCKEKTMRHDWKENAIDEGLFEGKMTCLQGWKCKCCKLVIFLPLGTNPRDYDHTVCKGG